MRFLPAILAPSVALLSVFPQLSAQAMDGEQGEVLFGYLPTREEVQFQVASNGCTSKDDFEFVISKADPIIITLMRTVPDKCRAIVPAGTTLTFSYEELGISRWTDYRIGNPLRDVHRVP